MVYFRQPPQLELMREVWDQVERSFIARMTWFQQAVQGRPAIVSLHASLVTNPTHGLFFPTSHDHAQTASENRFR